MAVTTKVITCQIHQHHMLCILFGIIAKYLCCYTVFLRITGSFCSACNRIDICFVLRIPRMIIDMLYPAMGLR